MSKLVPQQITFGQPATREIEGQTNSESLASLSHQYLLVGASSIERLDGGIQQRHVDGFRHIEKGSAPFDSGPHAATPGLGWLQHLRRSVARRNRSAQCS